MITAMSNVVGDIMLDQTEEDRDDIIDAFNQMTFGTQ